jgi:hypothetical protein
MTQQISTPLEGRARRYALRFPVYFREQDSMEWFKGTTENMSYTGVRFHSPSPLALKTMLDLRLPLAVGTKKGRRTAEIQCKGSVVRVEHSHLPETPIALAVAIHDYRIVRNSQLRGALRGTD